MIAMMSGAETDRSNELNFLGWAIGLHLMLFIWNPVIFQTVWKTVTAHGRGQDTIIVIDGPSNPGLPGAPSALRPPVGSPATRPLPWTHPSTAPLGIQHSIPTDQETMTSPVKLSPPLISKPFHLRRSPDLPMQVDRDLGAGRTVISIPVHSGTEPSIPTHSRQILIDHHATSTPLSAFGDPAPLTGQGGTGRILVRYTEPPAAIPEEPLQVSAPSANRAAQTGPHIEGLLANRPVIRRVIPEYPAWAEEKGVTGAVRLYFTVTADGKVNSAIQVRRTTGNADLDQLAIEALEKWQFEPAAPDVTPQWGIITFYFSLQSGGA